MTMFDAKIYERDIYQDSVYSAWLKNSNERDVLERVFRDRAGWWCKDNLAILDIGCGSGSAAQRAFKILDEKRFTFEYTGVDPYEDQLKRFRDDMAGKKSIELVCSTVESFTAPKKYDLTMMVHALYYVTSFEDILKKVSTTADKVILVHHGKFGINEVHQQFRSYVKPGPHTISTWEDVQHSLDTVGIPYTLEIRDTQVNISSCKDPKNEEGIKLIKFFLEHSELGPNIIEEVSDWFKKMPDMMKQDVGYFFIG